MQNKIKISAEELDRVLVIQSIFARKGYYVASPDAYFVDEKEIEEENKKQISQNKP